jgi:hypothetical protein
MHRSPVAAVDRCVAGNHGTTALDLEDLVRFEAFPTCEDAERQRVATAEDR